MDDYLIDVALTDGNSDVMLLSSAGRAMRFNEDKVRQMGRTAAGVRGIRMDEKDTVIGLIVVQDGMAVLTATEHGYGKRTPIEDYPAKGRGGLGVIDIKTTERNGAVIGAVQVAEDDEIMLITDAGTLVRTTVAEVSTVGRNTQGVRLIRLSKGETLVEITAIDEHDDHDDHDAIAAERSNDHTVGAEQGHDDRDADGDGDDDAEQGSDDVSAEQDNDADDD
ncbi:MAG: hypothetical protein CSA54_06205 [Gammaproteobacteria bacterium]|nr:MAG: hypothetical protein CSA54_06205 [Gammaproteobacteria bacterium]